MAEALWALMHINEIGSDTPTGMVQEDMVSVGDGYGPTIPHGQTRQVAISSFEQKIRKFLKIRTADFFTLPSPPTLDSSLAM